MSDHDSNNPRQVIGEICFSAFSRTWPTKTRGGIRGKESGVDGARAARVLAGLLLLAWRHSSLTVVRGLEPFGLDVGLVRYEAVRDALYDLEELGWITFELGTQDDWSPRGERGRPSRITLPPHPAEQTLNPNNLPTLTLDIFRYEALGSPGWLALTRISLDSSEWRSTSPPLGVKDVVELTGMTRSTVKRLLPKMVHHGVARQAGSKYTFYLLDQLDRHTFGDKKWFEHRDRLRNKQHRRNESKTPVLWRQGPNGPEKWDPLGYFPSGRPYWTMEQHDRGDSPLPSKTMRIDARRARTRHYFPPVLADDDEIQYLAEESEDRGRASVHPESDHTATLQGTESPSNNVESLVDRIKAADASRHSEQLLRHAQ